jgi:hypothetical protein
LRAVILVFDSSRYGITWGEGNGTVLPINLSRAVFIGLYKIDPIWFFIYAENMEILVDASAIMAVIAEEPEGVAVLSLTMGRTIVVTIRHYSVRGQAPNKIAQYDAF